MKKDPKKQVEEMRKEQEKKDRADERRGLRCPVCGCRDFLTGHTIPLSGVIRRYKTCRHCGKIIRTKETSEAQKK